MAKIVQITDEKNIKDYLNDFKDKSVVVQFHAKWCQPCKKLTPILLEKVKKANVDLIQLDVDENEENAEKFEVNGIPRVLFFKNGELVHDHTGADAQKLDEGFNKLK